MVEENQRVFSFEIILTRPCRNYRKTGRERYNYGEVQGLLVEDSPGQYLGMTSVQTVVVPATALPEQPDLG